MDTVQFVDSITAVPTVRLDLNNESPWAVTGVDFSPPALKQAWASTLLADGERLTAAAYANRRLRLSLELITTTKDASASALQTLWRELDRPFNVLRYQPDGATSPVFFRTMRSADNQVREYQGGGAASLRTVEVEIVAEPFALGLRETLPAVTVYNDPAEGTDLNANPYFETDAANWSASGGTIARSTAQAHEGVASLLLTPSGSAADVEATFSAYVSVTAGQPVRFSAWLRCAVARNADVFVVWSNGSVETGSASVTTPLAATTWTLVASTATPPVGTVWARLAVAMRSTPLASHLLHIDEARLRQAGGAGGMCFDVTSPKGDVEAPLFLSFAATDLTPTLGGWSSGYGRRQSVVAVRRGGTPSQAPMALQAETMSPNTDTTVQPNDTAMSGSGQNFMRTTFATATALDVRLLTSTFPATASVDVRGTYRVFARVRQTVGTDVMQMSMSYALDSSRLFGDIVTLPGGTVLRWVDLGTVQMPLGYDPESDGLSGTPLSVRGVQVVVYAARVSGSGSLDIDTLMFAPADDRYCAVRWPEYGSPTSYVLDSGSNQVYAVGASGEVRATVAEMAGLPPMISPGVTNRIVFLRDVGDETAAGDAITASVAVTPYYWPRYLHVRPVAS